MKLPVNQVKLACSSIINSHLQNCRGCHYITVKCSATESTRKFDQSSTLLTATLRVDRHHLEEKIDKTLSM